MYYSEFDKIKGHPIRLKGVINVQDGSVEKVKTQSEKFGVHIRSANWKGSGIFGCDGPAGCGSWFGAIKVATELHKTSVARKEAPKKHREVLGLPPEGLLVRKDIARAYKKMCLKHHPDRGGDKDEFNRVQDAYAAIMILQEVDELQENCIIFDYEAIIEKQPQKGLGLVVKEDKALGRVVVSKIEVGIKIHGMSEEGNGHIQIGDAIVGIDEDDTTDWPLSRIRGRLGPSRVPPGGKILFIFERRESTVQEEEEPTITPTATPSEPEVHSSWDNSSDTYDVPYSPEATQREQEAEQVFSMPYHHEMPPAPPTDPSSTKRDNVSKAERRESIRQELREIDMSEVTQEVKEVLDNSSPMSPIHRGSLREISLTDPSVQPLHEMEEMFDLLETIRNADINASCSDTDAFALKSLLGWENSREEDTVLSNNFIAQITAHRQAAAAESNEAYRILAKNLVVGDAPVTRREIYEQAGREATDVENLLKRIRA